MFKFLILISYLVCLPSATPQVHDILFYESTEYHMNYDLSDTFWKEIKIDPPSELFSENCMMTSCWNGYYVTWEVKNDSLYFKSLNSCCDGKKYHQSDLSSLLDVSHELISSNVFASWFTGEITTQFGKRINYDTQVWQNERTFFFENGQLIIFKDKSNEPTGDASYPGGIDLFKQFLYENLNWDKLPPEPYEGRIIFSFNVDIDGKLTLVEVRSPDFEFDESEAQRLFDKAPNWIPAYVKGEPVRQRWSIPLVFDQGIIQKYTH